MKILLENMEEKKTAERLYDEGGAKLPPIESDFVCRMISYRMESDPEGESEILKARLTPNTPRAVVPDVLLDLLIDRTHCGPSRASVGAS